MYPLTSPNDPMLSDSSCPVVVALTHFLTSPIRSGPRPDSLFKDVMFKALRFSLANLTLTQEKWINATTENNYLEFAKAEKFQPDTLVLPSGCKAHWIGNSKAEKIIVYFHGLYTSVPIMKRVPADMDIRRWICHALFTRSFQVSLFSIELSTLTDISPL